MSDKPSKHGLASTVMKVGPGAHRARQVAEARPERCANCGADLTGSGPLVVAFLETTAGDAVCGLECQ